MAVLETITSSMALATTPSLFSVGMGADRVQIDYRPIGGINTVRMAPGISPTQIAVTNIDGLKLAHSNGVDNLSLLGWDEVVDNRQVNRNDLLVTFADGTIWNADALAGPNARCYSERGHATRHVLHRCNPWWGRQGHSLGSYLPDASSRTCCTEKTGMTADAGPGCAPLRWCRRRSIDNAQRDRRDGWRRRK